MKTEKPIKLKTGETLPAGLPVCFKQPEATLCYVQGERAEPYKVRTTSAFRAPSMDELTEDYSDSVVQSVAGHGVEPDGWDSQGSPSWLLALGMI